MSFQGLQAKYRRLYSESAAWRLLRTDNAPYVLAFISSLFSEESEVAYGRARIILEAELERCRELGFWSTETSAATYLNQWIKSGWLREMDDYLVKTDASEVALRFAKGLDERHSGTTASHLRIVQEAVRDLAVAMSPNLEEKLQLLERKKAEIQKDIDAITAGVVPPLSEADQREALREIYQLASVLTGDFRRVEDDIRILDQQLRIQMIECEQSRGEVLLTLMEKESLLAKTDAGNAFEGFFQLLCDQNRTTEFREQLRNILKTAGYLLTPGQQYFLNHLMRELSYESERVFRVRRRTEEGLKTYIESGAASENHAVDRLIAQLERRAVTFRDEDIDLTTLLNLTLSVGPVEISSPESMKLKIPDESLDTSGVEEHTNTREPGTQMLECLETVQIRQLAAQVLQCLQCEGPMSIAQLAEHLPLSSGLEELVAFIRIAKSVGAAVLTNQQEDILVTDRTGAALRASIPTYLLTAELFPTHIDELTL